VDSFDAASEAIERHLAPVTRETVGSTRRSFHIFTATA
jgi:hypothetical protein